MHEATHDLMPPAKAESIRPRPRLAETREAEHPALNLQRTMGNQGVAHLFRSRAEGNEAGSAGTRSLGSYLSLHGPMASFAGTSIRPVTGLASNHQALAQARNGGIEIDASLADAPAAQVHSLLAHEAIHLAQQRGAGQPASVNLLEAEASQLSRHVLAGQPVWPVLSGPSATPLKQPQIGRAHV